jgi:hypothetical protein
MMDKPTYHIIAIPDNPATLVPPEVLVGRVIGGRRVFPHVRGWTGFRPLPYQANPSAAARRRPASCSAASAFSRSSVGTSNTRLSAGSFGNPL